MTKPNFIKTSVDGGIGRVVLNRPEVLNALNRGMVTEIVTALEAFDQNDDVRVIVLSGEGRAFAAGADIAEMAAEDPLDLELADPFAVWDRIGKVKKPLIAAVHGLAYGGGFELALACDLIFAAHDAKFAFPEVKLGVMPGAGGTQRLTKVMGKAKALEWLWLGEPMSAKEACHFGVVTRVVAAEGLMDEVHDFVRRLTQQAPLSLRLIKEAVHKAIDYPLDEGMQFERKNFYLLFASADQKEGMRAFLEKRKPLFKGE
ncbi:enoyl-CoA hydratase/isomerase family protein [Numidum massiliense]|uniref:enoyl-CoA hydratase/isomerase family protein n=1 Tax=Numidum massiliense TaxID=1522315 RepID=UPI0006D589CD|nr:enoyl-CoA hydratase-related protein [Numidum massiliense]